MISIFGKRIVNISFAVVVTLFVYCSNCFASSDPTAPGNYNIQQSGCVQEIYRRAFSAIPLDIAYTAVYWDLAYIGTKNFMFQETADTCSVILPESEQTISFCLTSKIASTECFTQKISDNWSQTWNSINGGTTFQVARSGDKICLQASTLFSNFYNLGCKYIKDPALISAAENCYMANSCNLNGQRNSKSVVSVSGLVVQCIQDTLTNIFKNNSTCSSNSPTGTNMFVYLQNSMRNYVQVALTLYVILFGLRIALGHHLPQKGELMMFIVKFALVMYFSVGISTSTIDNLSSPNNLNTNVTYNDGVTMLVQFFQSLTQTLSGIMFQAGGTQTLCNFTEMQYPAGYQYLSLWDALDCRLLYYSGFNIASLSSIGYLQGAELISTILSIFFPLLGMIKWLIMILFTGYFIYALLLAIFAVILFTVVIMFVHTMLSAILAIAVLAFLAPIIVPLSLFKFTSQVFQSWMKLFFSYSLQPLIIAAFVALMLTVFDSLMFGTCTFTNKNTSIEELVNSALSATSQTAKTADKVVSEGQKIITDPTKKAQKDMINSAINLAPGISLSKILPFYVMDASSDVACTSTFGYLLFAPSASNSQSTSGQTIINSTLPGLIYNTNWSSFTSQTLPSLIGMVFFGYLFYAFIDSVGPLSNAISHASLEGNSVSGRAGGSLVQGLKQATQMAVDLAKKRGGGGGGAGGGGAGSGAKLGG
jgi:type IV secretory pathway VirB6-like protein